jgi:hypothetical protein
MSKIVYSQLEFEKLLQNENSPDVKIPQINGHILCAEDNRCLIAYLVNKTASRLTQIDDGQ